MTNSNRQCKLAGPQHREIGSPISTDNASWGGAQHRSWRKVSLQKCASWRGPNIEKLEPQFLQTMQVGVGHR
ncbi:nitrogen fixation protein NifR [Staphylococcus aureus]|nr:nitrogen fixation protein NifR [Staphylococcus aureus]RNH41723.1 nitrogen fixation protein NifR [Staphylococcus aureus]RNH53087.1 nitrogen fixation protein NifR [Staphylococcus aureus]HAR7225167.1 nitrogen fixation protein NifR [Staphylococcus aureus]